MPATTIQTHHRLLAILLVAAMLPLARGNLVENPSMEGSFLAQGSLGEVAQDWIGWTDWRYTLEGEFSESGAARTGSKSQKIAWDEPSPSPPRGKGSPVSIMTAYTGRSTRCRRANSAGRRSGSTVRCLERGKAK